MSYNTKNYMEQGGEVLHIGGKVEFGEGASFEGGIVPNVASGTTVANLIAALKDGGIIVSDTMTLNAANNVTDSTAANANRTYNTGKISSVAVADDIVTITLSEKVKNLKDFDGGGAWGVHKWLGIDVSVSGVSPITKLQFNGTQLTTDDVNEATAMGLSAGHFVLWVKADQIINGKSNQFTLWASTYKKATYTLVVVEPEDAEGA